MISTVLPREIAVLHCIAKFFEDAAAQAVFPCCRAEGLWERECTAVRKAITETFAEVSFHAFSKTGAPFHTFQIFLYFSADACRTPTFVWFEA